jgi:hypothetical protein
MEISDVRKGLHNAMARGRQRSADRRDRTDAASRAFDAFLDTIAVPLVRQIANVLRAERYAFSVFTPAGSVRLMSDRSAEDFIEVTLDTVGDTPRVVARTSRRRGQRVVDIEHVVASGDPAAITEEELFRFLLRELEQFVEK